MRFVPGDDLRDACCATEGRLEPERAARHHRPGGLGARRRARARPRPPRRQARQRAGDAGRPRVPDRLRADASASTADTEATRTGIVLGTLDYIAPEQIRGDAIGPFTDVYSLGCMIMHLLTGQVPFTVDDRGGQAVGALLRAAAAAERARARARRRVRPDRRARDGQAPGGPLRDRRRGRRRDDRRRRRRHRLPRRLRLPLAPRRPPARPRPRAATCSPPRDRAVQRRGARRAARRRRAARARSR